MLVGLSTNTEFLHIPIIDEWIGYQNHQVFNIVLEKYNLTCKANSLKVYLPESYQHHVKLHNSSNDSFDVRVNHFYACPALIFLQSHRH